MSTGPQSLYGSQSSAWSCLPHLEVELKECGRQDLSCSQLVCSCSTGSLGWTSSHLHRIPVLMLYACYTLFFLWVFWFLVTLGISWSGRVTTHLESNNFRSEPREMQHSVKTAVRRWPSKAWVLETSTRDEWPLKQNFWYIHSCSPFLMSLSEPYLLWDQQRG